jgi:hypothetical protein
MALIGNRLGLIAQLREALRSLSRARVWRGDTRETGRGRDSPASDPHSAPDPRAVTAKWPDSSGVGYSETTGRSNDAAEAPDHP